LLSKLTLIWTWEEIYRENVSYSIRIQPNGSIARKFPNHVLSGYTSFTINLAGHIWESGSGLKNKSTVDWFSSNSNTFGVLFFIHYSGAMKFEITIIIIVTWNIIQSQIINVQMISSIFLQNSQCRQYQTWNLWQGLSQVIHRIYFQVSWMYDTLQWIKCCRDFPLEGKSVLVVAYTNARPWLVASMILIIFLDNFSSCKCDDRNHLSTLYFKISQPNMHTLCLQSYSQKTYVCLNTWGMQHQAVCLEYWSWYLSAAHQFLFQKFETSLSILSQSIQKQQFFHRNFPLH